ncbi:hypothetical protein [Prauserella cavernicola]|uniref:Uncharacterized protein n=1 Tax=Prauserella cavernicola TaxID=2800127 RepID=A0A934QU02_9PSEU|nr:hypothetical protein [Prauserella cavernicola]MBK1786405.1 hypothetical protein [Prauserella cavernicola]
MSSSPQPAPGRPQQAAAPALGDAAERLVALLRLRHPRVHLGTLIVLGVLVAVCVAATLTRLSPLPLLPLAPFAVAALAAWRARSAGTDRQLLGWSVSAALATAVGFWVLSLVGRIL